MKFEEEINPLIGLSILIMCFGISFSLLALIFKLVGDNELNIAWFNVVCGSCILILLTYIYINVILFREKESCEKEKKRRG